MQHVQKRFELKAGDSREDIAMIVSVTEDDSFLPRRIEMPSTVGDEFQDGELLRVQRVA